MKTLICSLAAMLSVGLSSAMFAASAREQQISGTVVFYNPHVLTIEDSKKEEHPFRVGWPTGQHYVRKKVTR
jgi:hypothetical protein